jgi:membrane-associated phospholipid phosphatase
MDLWWHLSNLGDVATMGIVAAIIAAGLMFGRDWRAALVWCLLIATGMLLVVMSKIAFLGWGLGICALDFTGFSGHATRAMAIGPIFFYLTLRKASRVLRITGVLLGIMFGIAIGISRLVLHVHSISEVIAGWILGGGVAFVFAWCGGKLQDFDLNRYALIPGAIAVFMLPAPGIGTTQRVLVDVSLFLSGRGTPFARQDCDPAVHELRTLAESHGCQNR